MPQKLKHISKFSKANLLVVIMVFCGIGGYTLLNSFAAGGSPSVYWGAWIDGDTYSIGQGDAPWTSSTWNSFEQHTAKNVSMVHFGQPAPWTQAFAATPFDLSVARGAIPVEDMNSASTSLSSIASGTYDSSIITWANAVKTWGHPMMLRWDWEMNGTWFNWGAQAQANPADYVAAWRHFHDIVAAQGATNVTWVWCPNTEFSGSTPIDQLYPGDSYVDWTGIDGYNWGTNSLKPDSWKTFSQVIKPTYNHLLQISLKPIMLAETASSEIGGNKAAWITDALATQLPLNYPNIKAALWFNWNITEGSGRMDWPIESSTSAQNAFATGIANSYYSTNTFGSLPNLTKVQPLSVVRSSNYVNGDANTDGQVNVTDLSILLSSYGTTNIAPDFNQDGAVNIVDLSILLSHYGQSNAVIQIPSNIASDCSVDVTAAINSWMSSASNSSTLNFGVNKCYRIEGILKLQNRSSIGLAGNGSTFKSLNAPNDQRPLWQVLDSTAIKFDNMNVIGSYAIPGTFTSSLQHAHGIDLRGTNAEIAGVNITNVAGDCVYYGLGSNNITRSSGSYHDSVCRGTGRNGVSLVAADNVTVQRNSTDIIGYETFDVEPNAGAGFGDCHDTFDSNTINNYSLHAFSIVETAAICDQSFTNNHIIGPKGLKIAIGDPMNAGFRASTVKITGNSADNPASPTPINADHIDYLTITGNTVPMTGGGYLAAVDGGCQINVSGNTIVGGGGQLYQVNPVSSC